MIFAKSAGKIRIKKLIQKSRETCLESSSFAHLCIDFHQIEMMPRYFRNISRKDVSHTKKNTSSKIMILEKFSPHWNPSGVSPAKQILAGGTHHRVVVGEKSFSKIIPLLNRYDIRNFVPGGCVSLESKNI